MKEVYKKSSGALPPNERRVQMQKPNEFHCLIRLSRNDANKRYTPDSLLRTVAGGRILVEVIVKPPYPPDAKDSAASIRIVLGGWICLLVPFSSRILEHTNALGFCQGVPNSMVGQI